MNCLRINLPRSRLQAFAALIAGVVLSALPAASQEPPISQPPADSQSATRANVEYWRLAGERAGQERHDNELLMQLVWCPPGTFVVENRLVTQAHVQLPVAVEKPDNDDVAVDEFTGETVIDDVITVFPKKVILTRGYWLGKFEVTREEWRRIMGTEPWANRKVVVSGGDFPATYVSWNAASEFCRKFTDLERTAGRLPAGWEYVLPTDTQWERACRANTDTEYSFGENAATLDEYAWFRANTHAADEPFPHRVGQKKPNAWGFYDMHGNVVEWCRDWYGPYPGGRDPEITEPDSIAHLKKVQRGGDWSRIAACCRSRSRDMAPPEVRNLGFGFRVALSTVR
jgi:formylglycine-generating enzyme required for sulfatase activity